MCKSTFEIVRGIDIYFGKSEKYEDDIKEFLKNDLKYYFLC